MTEQSRCELQACPHPAHWVSLKSHLTSLGLSDVGGSFRPEEETYRSSHDSHWQNWNEKPLVPASCLLNNSSPKCHCHFVIPKPGGSLATYHKLLGSGSVPQKKNFLFHVEYREMQIQLPQLEQSRLNRVSFSCFGRNHLEILGSESSISTTSRSKTKKKSSVP